MFSVFSPIWTFRRLMQFSNAHRPMLWAFSVSIVSNARQLAKAASSIAVTVAGRTTRLSVVFADRGLLNASPRLGMTARSVIDKSNTSKAFSDCLIYVKSSAFMLPLIASLRTEPSVTSVLKFPAVLSTMRPSKYFTGRVTVKSLPFLSVMVTFSRAVAESLILAGAVSVTLALPVTTAPSAKLGLVTCTPHISCVVAERVLTSMPVPLSLVTVAARVV